MKKLTIDTAKLSDHQTSLLMDLFCDVLGGQEMLDITNEPHTFTLSVETVTPNKDDKIREIKRILEKCCNGSTSTCELEAESSPCISSSGTNKMNVSVLVERFSINDVGVFTYNNEQEIAEGDLTYEELSEDVIDEILELLEQKEVEDDKTMERCV
jgi:CRISPR/Cas system-associated exonuclease Cas4 (RecB family)